MSTRTNFPGVYTTVLDSSYGADPATSRFQVALLGPTEKGPINVPTRTRSIKEYTRLFGRSFSGTFVPNAAAVVSSISDGSVVVRVAQQYEPVAVDGSGAQNATSVATVGANRFTAGNYARVRQIGHDTTVNAKVASVGADPTGPINFVTGSKLASSYTAGEVSLAKTANSANEAETFLYANTWATELANVAACSDISDPTLGSKNFFKFVLKGTAPGDVTSAKAALPAGTIIQLTHSTSKATRELRVKEIVAGSNVVVCDAVNNQKAGYQALPLQATYGASVGTGATIAKKASTAKLLHLFAKTPGTWANSNGVDTGMWVTVSPGSAADTKKIQVFDGGGLVETFDNLTNDPSTPDFILTKLATSAQLECKIIGTLSVTAMSRDGNKVTAEFATPHGISTTDWVTIQGADVAEFNGTFLATRSTANEVTYEVPSYVGDTANVTDASQVQATLSTSLIPANTIKAWDLNVTPLNFATFAKGLNGENVQDDDYIGTIDPSTGKGTGLKVFEDTDSLNVDAIWVSSIGSNGVSMDVCQAISAAAKTQNAIGVVHGDRGLTGRDAMDYTNADGKFTSRGDKLDDYRLSFWWNWIEMTDPWTNQKVFVPPSIGKLRAMAYTFDQFKPWYGAAGENRGLLPEASNLEFTSVSASLKNTITGGGQCVNVVIKHFEKFMVWGNRTTLRNEESKLAYENSVICTNHLMKGLSEIGRKFVFDPNDQELLLHILTEYRDFLESVKKERGIEEDYTLQIDTKNNTTEVRARREVVVDLAFVPVDTAERVFINATVRETGAMLNSVA